MQNNFVCEEEWHEKWEAQGKESQILYGFLIFLFEFKPNHIWFSPNKIDEIL